MKQSIEFELPSVQPEAIPVFYGAFPRLTVVYLGFVYALAFFSFLFAKLIWSAIQHNHSRTGVRY